MDLHFCSRCGISIPQSEIDAGGAGGPGGKYFCAEHRAGAAVAVAEAPPGASREDLELLFCANCSVSIPVGDAQSGRAHREFGSLLCAGCSKADPGERAARREAVEAEMAADVDAQDPVVARRCSVCSAAVPYGQIVAGKAKLDGNRVVCERCHAASVASPGARHATADTGTSGILWALLIVMALAVGFFVTRGWSESRKANEPKPDTTAETRHLIKTETDARFGAMEQRLADAIRRSGEPDAAAEALLKTQAAEIANLRQMLDSARAESAKAEADLAQRLARLEGENSGLKERVRDLASRAPTIVEKGPEPPPVAPPAPAGGDGPKPREVNPEVARLCKDLLESPDDGVRFNAATELTRLKDPDAIPSLVKPLISDKHYFVRRGCARALGAVKAWFAVPVLVKALEDREVYVALAANIALQSITGVDFGVTQDTQAGQRKTKAAAAEKWWDKNKEKPPEGVSLRAITD